MPISNENTFIFIHIPKTGGTSIEHALNLHGDKKENRESFFGNITSPDLIKMNLSSNKLQHLTFIDLKKLISDTDFHRYFKFAIVRNPWDKMVSEYTFSCDTKNTTFHEFVDYTLKSHDIHWLDQYKFVTDDKGNIAVDYLGRFENLNSDFKIICEKTGISRANLPHKQKAIRLHYSCYYTDELKQKIFLRYKKDIEMFGYKFEKLSFFARSKNKAVFFVHNFVSKYVHESLKRPLKSIVGK